MKTSTQPKKTCPNWKRTIKELPKKINVKSVAVVAALVEPATTGMIIHELFNGHSKVQ